MARLKALVSRSLLDSVAPVILDGAESSSPLKKMRRTTKRNNIMVDLVSQIKKTLESQGDLDVCSKCDDILGELKAVNDKRHSDLLSGKMQNDKLKDQIHKLREELGDFTEKEAGKVRTSTHSMLSKSMMLQEQTDRYKQQIIDSVDRTTAYWAKIKDQTSAEPDDSAVAKLEVDTRELKKWRQAVEEKMGPIQEQSERHARLLTIVTASPTHLEDLNGLVVASLDVEEQYRETLRRHLAGVREKLSGIIEEITEELNVAVIGADGSKRD
jgi:hypothetical protein